MRLSLACVWLLGCAHASTEPPITLPASPISVAQKPSFLERTRPRHPVKDVSHVEVIVQRREGPESMVLGLATIDRLATACYRDDQSLILFPTDFDASVTMTIDTRRDGSMEEVLIEPPTTPAKIAMCLIHALAAQPLHAEPGPHHVVLTIDTHVWWTS